MNKNKFLVIISYKNIKTEKNLILGLASNYLTIYIQKKNLPNKYLSYVVGSYLFRRKEKIILSTRHKGIKAHFFSLYPYKNFILI